MMLDSSWSSPYLPWHSSGLDDQFEHGNLWSIESIVSFPIKNGDVPQFFVNVYRQYHSWWNAQAAAEFSSIHVVQTSGVPLWDGEIGTTTRFFVDFEVFVVFPWFIDVYFWIHPFWFFLYGRHARKNESWAGQLVVDTRKNDETSNRWTFFLVNIAIWAYTP